MIIKHYTRISPLKEAVKRLKSILIEEHNKVVELMVELFIAGEEPLTPDHEVDLYVFATLALSACLEAAIEKAGGLDTISDAATRSSCRRWPELGLGRQPHRRTELVDLRAAAVSPQCRIWFACFI
jgi:hypothetical protein